MYLLLKNGQVLLRGFSSNGAATNIEKAGTSEFRNAFVPSTFQGSGLYMILPPDLHTRNNIQLTAYRV